MPERENREDASTDETTDEAETRIEISPAVAARDIDQTMSGVALDLGVGGLYMVTPHDLPVGTLVELEFTLDGLDRDFYLLGDLRWRQDQPIGDENRHGLGFEFIDLDPADRRALEAFIDQHEPLENPEERHELAAASSAVETDNQRGAGDRVAISAETAFRTVANFANPPESEARESGIYIETPREYPVGTVVDLQFRLGETDQHLRVVGEICWQRPHPTADAHQYGVDLETVRLAEPGEEYEELRIRIDEEQDD